MSENYLDEVMEEFLEKRIREEDFQCDECGEEISEENRAFVYEIDPSIKIEGFDYPHRFLVHKECAEKIMEGAAE